MSKGYDFKTNGSLSLIILLLLSVVVRGQVAEPQGELSL